MKIKHQKYSKPTENVNRTHFKKSKIPKHSVDNRRNLKAKKNKNTIDINKKIIDMKNTTAEILNKRNPKKNKINTFRQNKSSLPSNIPSSRGSGFEKAWPSNSYCK